MLILVEGGLSARELVLTNSVGMIGVRPFRAAFGAISKDPAAKREIRRKAAVSGRVRLGAGRRDAERRPVRLRRRRTSRSRVLN